MHIVCAGLSHKTAPVEVRERFALSGQELKEALLDLIQSESISETVIISTCNRSEIYAAVSDPARFKRDVTQYLSLLCGLDSRSIEKYLYFKETTQAAEHLFSVASSLDSMLLGEAQILGQVKEAYETALEAGVTATIFNRLFREALLVGKRVRSETSIGENAVSVSSIAVTLAKKVFETLEGRTILVLGAGEMSELAVKNLVSSGASSIFVANRNFEAAKEMAARFNGRAIGFDDFPKELERADIVIGSTAAPHFVVTKDQVAAAMKARRGRLIFFIDIAVPRDIDPKVDELDNVFLYDIDDLKTVADFNLAERKKEAAKAAKIVEAGVDSFILWLGSLEVVPTISALKGQAEDIRSKEIEKVLSKLSHLSQVDKETIDALSTSIINKLLHRPIVSLKESANTKGGYVYIDSLRHIFGLDGGGDGKR